MKTASYAWWPGYCEDVERYVGRCEDVERYVGRCAMCSKLRPNKQHHTHTWPEKQKPWSRVHMDHGQVPGIGLFLIVVDAYSGWPDVVVVPNRRAETVRRVM